MENDYRNAWKKGHRYTRQRITRGLYPNLPVLDEILPGNRQMIGKDLGLVQIPLEWVVGTVTSARAVSFAGNYKGIDVLVTHAPAFGLGDLDTLPHRGFRCFLKFLEKYRPRYMLHGHVHRNYGFKIPVTQKYLGTTIINACGAYLLDL